MTTVSQLWTGHDTYGRAVEVAQRSDGAWFSRAMERSRYGLQWSKWRPCTPEWRTSVPDLRGEIVEVPAFIAWGFQRLWKADVLPKYRLPKAA